MSHEPPPEIIADQDSPLPPDEAVTVPSQMAAAPLPAASYHEPVGARQTIDEVLLAPPRRCWLLPLVLFLATCFTTFMSGVYAWGMPGTGSGNNSGFLTIDATTPQWIELHVGKTASCIWAP